MTTKDNLKRTKRPWPTKAAMQQVYNNNLWGSGTSRFYSGEGSHHPDLVNPYIEVVKFFLNSFDYPITVADLGCGDFNIGKQLYNFTNKYIAVDIVPDLIRYNQEEFQAENLEFYSLDLAKDNLPLADCALIRQVLQHISNAEVQSILDKLTVYKYIIITEHIPKGSFISNKDIISGQGTRLKKQSGLNLLKAPFNWIVKEETPLLSIPLDHDKGIIVTTLYKMF